MLTINLKTNTMKKINFLQIIKIAFLVTILIAGVFIIHDAFINGARV